MSEVAGDAAAGEALPSTVVLSYVANMSTPTRVRVVAARALMVWGGVNVLLGTWALAVVGTDVYRTAKDLARGRLGWLRMGGRRKAIPVSVNVHDVLQAVGQEIRYLITGGLIHLWFSRGVRRGRRAATLLSIAALGPQIAVIVLLTALAICGIVLEGLGFGFGRSARPMLLMWVTMLPVPVVGILVLHDVLKFLRWIRRNPMTERTGEPFIEVGGKP